MARQWRRGLIAATASLVSPRALKLLRYRYASLLARLGIDFFPAHDALDRKLLAHLGNARDGVFVEAGANDGLSQSNTWHLERRLGWTGLLIEPTPELAALCRRFRPRSTVVRCALGAPDQQGTSLTLHFGGLMTAADTADAAHMTGGSAETHAREGAAWTGRDSYAFDAPVRTLDELLRENGMTRVDLLSLDVEGYEVPALRGLDLDALAPRFILVETSSFDAVAGVLGDRYRLVEALSRHDYLFRAV